MLDEPKSYQQTNGEENGHNGQPIFPSPPQSKQEAYTQDDARDFTRNYVEAAEGQQGPNQAGSEVSCGQGDELLSTTHVGQRQASAFHSHKVQDVLTTPPSCGSRDIDSTRPPGSWYTVSVTASYTCLTLVFAYQCNKPLLRDQIRGRQSQASAKQSVSYQDLSRAKLMIYTLNGHNTQRTYLLRSVM
jgi:hypothetical protein